MDRRKNESWEDRAKRKAQSAALHTLHFNSELSKSFENFVEAKAKRNKTGHAKAENAGSTPLDIDHGGVPSTGPLEYEAPPSPVTGSPQEGSGANPEVAPTVTTHP